MIKNYGKSIRAKLLNLAKSEKQEYMKILARYFHERLLYRVSQSEYKPHLLLKGSSLLYAHYMFTARPTIDIDLLGHQISNDMEYIKDVFREIMMIECTEDGVVFDKDSLVAKPIAVEKKYPGINLSFNAHLDTIVYPVSIDIGFGDVVTPCPVSLDYPILIESVPSVEILSYSLETLIAEKFHAMIDRDVDNSRMKDFYDVYHLFLSEDVNRELLEEAIRNTFMNRGTHYIEGKNLFDEGFAKDPARNQKWKGFLKRLRLKDKVEFYDVMDIIRKNLEPYWNCKL